VDSIILDDENPRLAFTKIEKEIKKWTSESMSEEIKESYAFNNLLHSIQEYGVMDPIWVHDLGDTKYKVVEGNMRVTVLKYLIANNATPPPDIDYKFVKSHIIEKNTPKNDIDAQKAVLQTGKNPWGAFNEASHIYDLFFKHGSGFKEIAQMLGKSESRINNTIDDFQTYKKFIEFLRKNDLPIDPNKYSFFADASASVKQKFFLSPKSLQEFFKLITPNENGITRIPSVSNRGGLKTFSKFVNDDQTLNYFTKNLTVTVDDALLYYQEKSISKKKTWMKKIPPIVRGMQKLSQKDRQEILEGYTAKADLKKLQHELKKFFE